MTNVPYCGRGAVPTGRQRGTQAECLNTGRVLMWGERAVDPRLLAADRLPDLDIIRGKSNVMVQRARRIRKEQAECQTTLRSENANEKRRRAAQIHLDKLEREYERLKARVPKMKETIAEAERRHREYAELVRRVERDERRAARSSRDARHSSPEESRQKKKRRRRE